MASIQGYLGRLEARLAPSLDAHALQERLTEAENHLRDRAQEFEEVGLPPVEAEARAVAAFGDLEEFTEEIAVESTLLTDTRKPPRVEVALQLSASALTLGLLGSLLLFPAPLVVGGVAACASVMLAALFGQAPSLRRLSALSLASALGLFAVLTIAYVPGRDWTFDLRRDVEVRRSLGGFDQETIVERLRVFGRYQARMVQGSSLPLGEHGGVLAPSQDPYSNDLVEYFGASGQRLARRMWDQNGELVVARLSQAAVASNPSGWAHDASRRWRLDAGLMDRADAFAPLAFFGGVLLLALLTGGQAIGSALRAVFLAVLRRTGAPRSPEGHWNRR